MTPERWRRVKELFQAALEHEDRERAAFLARACAGDTQLRAEIESLIASHEQMGSFLETPTIADRPEPADADAESEVGRRIGPYRLVGELGRGGMGTVYLGVRADDQYRKRVAIKLVKSERASDFFLRRFRDERQILASLDHPNIAKLLDGGTTDDGRPFFVMEYIEGKPIDVYCDDGRLSVPKRLELFRTVCSAVHYAHQNLVVHRDIKPSNILVQDGTPKLLDFGIAKLLDPATAAGVDPTVTMHQLLTPDYASPEQVRGEPISTSTDVYSLGVLLYELLTGHRPHRLSERPPHQILSAICEEEPPAPSSAVLRTEAITDPGTGSSPVTPDAVSRARAATPEQLRRRLSGDLDMIVLAALRKEPLRRYASVERLSEDIRRHLVGLPVSARKDTLRYRAGKFARRHRAGVIAGCLAAASLVAGTAATAWQARLARRERARAERRFNDVRNLANSFIFDFYYAIEKLPGSTEARALVVKKALEYLDSLAQEASGDHTLQRELGVAYQRVGEAQGGPYTSHLGDTTGALESFRKGLAVREAVVAAEPSSREDRRYLAVGYMKLGDLLPFAGQTAEGLAHDRKALPILEALAAETPQDTRARRDLVAVNSRIGNLLTATGDHKGALETYRRVLPVAQGLAAQPGEFEDHANLWMVDSLMGDGLNRSGDTAGALEHHLKSLALMEEQRRSRPKDVEVLRDLSVSQDRIGDVLVERGDPAAALGHFREGLALAEALAAPDPKDARARRDVAVGHTKVAKALTAKGDVAGAMQSQRRALAIREALAAADPENAEALRDLCSSLFGIGRLEALRGETRAALESFRKALAIEERQVARDPSSAVVRADAAESRVQVGAMLARLGDLEGAVDGYQKARVVYEDLTRTDPTDAEVGKGLAVVYLKLGEAHAALASNAAPASKKAEIWREARSWFEKSLASVRDLGARGIPTDPDDEARPDRLAREIAGCDAALARLAPGRRR